MVFQIVSHDKIVFLQSGLEENGIFLYAGRTMCSPSPPWGTIKIPDLQRAHFSTAKTTPPLVIMSPETRSDYLFT